MGGAYRSNYTRKAFRNLYTNLYGLKRVRVDGRKTYVNSLFIILSKMLVLRMRFSLLAAEGSEASWNGGGVSFPQQHLSSSEKKYNPHRTII